MLSQLHHLNLQLPLCVSLQLYWHSYREEG